MTSTQVIGSNSNSGSDKSLVTGVNAGVGSSTTTSSNHPSFKRRLSLFSFGSSSSLSRKGSVSQPGPINTNASTSPSQKSQLMSPIVSPDYEVESSTPQQSDIFERSVQDSCCSPTASVPKCNRCVSTRSRSCTHNSSISIQGGQYLKQEDCIPAALDATASLLNDKDTNLDNVEMIYSNRRNSSVIGLNMALGRPFAPSRKNSTYLMNSFAAQQSQPQLPTQQSPQTQTSSVSPPKLTSSKSAVNFYSYADMISNDEFSRRPLGTPLHSQSFVPTLQSLQNSASISTSSTGQSQLSSPPSYRFGPLHRSSTSGLERSNSNASSQFSHLSKQIMKQQQQQVKSSKSNLQPSQQLINKKFLISPESSDNEENGDYVKESVGRHMSISSGQSFKSSFSQGVPDNESLVSTSIGDCIRRTHTELNGISTTN